MRILVTGSSGFVGSRLAFPDHEEMRVDIAEGVDILDGDTAEVIRAFDPEVVFHLAAHHFIPWCEENPTLVDRLNVMGTGMMLGACGPSLRTFVLASSAAVYGFKSRPAFETDALDGNDVYARSKIAAESLLVRYAGLHPEVRCVAARLFNVVGPGDSWPHVLPKILERHLNHQVVSLGNVWPQRDYVHVDDVASALGFLAENAPLGFTPYNVGTGIGTTVTELVSRVMWATGREVFTRPAVPRPNDGHLLADVRKTAGLGWISTRTLGEAVSDALEAVGVG